MSDLSIEQAIAEMRDLVRCRCHPGFKDRGLHDPDCNCDSAEAVEVLVSALPAVQPDRERIAFSMWKAEADRAAPNVGKHRSPSGFMAVSEQERDRWLGLADAVIAALRGEAEPNEYERKVAQMKEDFPNGI